MGEIFAQLLTTDGLVSLLSLTIVLIILDVDNVIFISILTNSLPAKEQVKARSYGLGFTIIIRAVLLMLAGYLATLEEPLFHIHLDVAHVDEAISIKDLIVTAGGLFLLYKSTTEIYNKLEGEEEDVSGKKGDSFAQVLGSIAVLNVIFSVDSVVTAVGMTKSQIVMAIGMLISIIIIFIFQGKIGEFISAHPSAKLLALSFLILIGAFLIIEGVHVVHISKGYIYFAMAFSLAVELLNIRFRKKGKPVHLHNLPSQQVNQSSLPNE
jgi:predicted tellurium resistance membrane protein TerC